MFARRLELYSGIDYSADNDELNDRHHTYRKILPTSLNNAILFFFCFKNYLSVRCKFNFNVLIFLYTLNLQFYVKLIQKFVKKIYRIKDCFLYNFYEIKQKLFYTQIKLFNYQTK